MSVNGPKSVWLVVEDSDDDYRLLERACLRVQPSPELHWVKSGLEAQSYLVGAGLYSDRKRFPLPAIILSDVKMPQMDGFELLEWVQQQPAFRGLRFVILTSSDLKRDRDRAQQLGADAYLVKPTGAKDMLETVRLVVD